MLIDVRCDADPVAPKDFEFVERKGLGHPDTLCDAIAERASVYYSRHCIERFGRVAHHWFDKVMLVGGEADVSFGHGELVKPYRVVVAGKGAFRVGEYRIPLEEILRTAAADVCSEVLTGFDATRHLQVECAVVDHQGAGRRASRYRPTTVDELPFADEKRRVSNDANLLSAFAPLSVVERSVLGVEQYINGAGFKAANPDTGSDVKVIGIRHQEELRFIVSVPWIASRVGSEAEYSKRSEEVKQDIARYLQDIARCSIELTFNPTDLGGSPYFTALGTVADTGDVGVVGRGNRANGLITPMRPMSIEAPAGKNPLDHTGKIYTVVAQQLSNAIHALTGKPNEVYIATAKETPIGDAESIAIRVGGEVVLDVEEQAPLAELARETIEGAPAVTKMLLSGEMALW